MAKQEDPAEQGPPQQGESAVELVYESNPKHKEPWQTGRRGSLCEPEVEQHAERLLRESALVGAKRYAVHAGKAYCAQEHTEGRWHGYPIGWNEVPPKLAIEWEKAGRVTKRDRKRYKETH